MDDGKAGEENMRFFSRAFSLPITPRAGVPRTLGNLRSDNGDENIKKAIGSVSKTTTLHVHHAFCLYISLPSLQDYDMQMPSFTF